MVTRDQLEAGQRLRKICDTINRISPTMRFNDGWAFEDVLRLAAKWLRMDFADHYPVERMLDHMDARLAEPNIQHLCTDSLEGERRQAAVEIDKTVYGELQFKPDPQFPHLCTEQCERLAAEALQAMDASQPRWIETPANYRCYVVPQHIFITDYDRLDENGNPCPEGVMMALIVRKRDGKRFKPASWIPAQIDHDVFVRNMERVYYLEEA